ncbi:MAG TPA: hypothetical protein VFE05_22830 [Longimicrobiaceae bacterium]|jgi:hypothetical protein|nr:hypothetical protein [Longimicrobiaceae bacterium]
MPRYDRQYDYGLRGPAEAFRGRQPGPPQGGFGYGNGYDYGYRGGGQEYRPAQVHVTQRYNRDYVFGGGARDEHRLNYVPYGGDVEGRVGDMRQYARPYSTISGTRTSRGGGQQVGWERGPGYDSRPRYDSGYRYDSNYRRGGW